MKKLSAPVKNFFITLLILELTFALCLLLSNSYGIEREITGIFGFAVLLTSFLTDGYLYGVAAAVISMLAVNYAFTFPYFAFDFSSPGNFISAVVMVSISLLASTLTTRLKQQKMMRAESEKERIRANLLRAISHDLRTPLTTIYGASSAMLDNEDSMTPDQRRTMLLNIKEDAEWLVQMVENLLSITRIDSGKVKIIKTPTVLDELVDSVLHKFKKRYPNQTVQLDLPEKIVVIPMDATLIEQVILNILDNAVQHAKGMTRLSLRVFLLKAQAVFEISDNGCGISEEQLKYIFTGYHSSRDKPADSRKRNSGIGLSVCATIVRAHGGSIQAKNHPFGNGAVFRFILETEDADIE